ncbi:barstar family protein [Actinoplanes sp. TFC3]|uniref:barstar family protein n=1 Tax=Actinoplanes sp. TFC3 TaxID=1710355 RepID=UPI000AEAE691|nr:barstar family protein [Actinoplanes sp. TFC3]
MQIDLSGVSTARELHAVLKRALDFPDFYGHNWAAFNDAVTGLVELPDEVVFRGWSQVCAALPRDTRIMREILDDFAGTHTGQRFSYEG